VRKVHGISGLGKELVLGMVLAALQLLSVISDYLGTMIDQFFLHFDINGMAKCGFGTIAGNI
jgi:hypothetical protein